MIVFLIGMPGSGKSYFGKEISSETGMPHCDLDSYIETMENHSVSILIDKFGINAFREMEKKYIEEIVTKHKSLIFSLGGGSVTIKNMMTYLNNHGITIYLDVSINVIVSRLCGDISRPLLTDDLKNPLNEFALRTKLLQLFHERKPLFDQAQNRINPITDKQVLIDIIIGNK